MKTIQREKKLSKIQKIFFGIFAFAFTVGSGIFLSNSNFLKADIFDSTETSQNVQQDTIFYIPNNYKTKAGQSGEIVVKTHAQIDSLLGFTFDIEYPFNSLQFEGISTKGGALDGKNFFVQENTNIEGKISVVGATGGESVVVEAEKDFIFLSFSIKKDISPEMKNIVLELNNMKIIGSDMQEKEAKTENGNIEIIHDFSELRINNFEVSENGELSLSFNNLLKEDISLDDFTFVPEAKNKFSTVHIDKENITFKRLDLIGGEKYELQFTNQNFGKKGEKIEDEMNPISFYVAKDKSPIFQIIKSEIENVEKNEITLYFSEEIDKESVQLQDFQSQNLEIEKFTILSDNKRIKVTFSDETEIRNLQNPDPFRVFYMEAKSGKPLTGYLTDIFIYPENISEKGPEMKEAIRLDNETIQLNFFNTLNEKTVDLEHFRIYKFTNIETCKLCDESGCDENKNLINENTKIEISADKKTITFSNLDLEPTEEYVVMIQKETIEDAEKHTTRYNQLKFAVNNSAKEYDRNFGIVEPNGVIAIDNETISIEFTKEPSAESMKNIYFDIKNANKNIEIYSVTQDESNHKKYILKTSVQTPLDRYVLSLNPKYFETKEHKFLGGKNTVIYTAAEAPKEFTISEISPYRVVIGTTEELVITGQNIPNDLKIYASTYNFEPIEITETKARFKIPKNILKNVYDLELKWTDGGINKNMTKTSAFIVEDVQKDEISVLSEKSYASPKKVKNDGHDTTNLYVFVDDSRGLADLEKVTADLRIIDGPAVAVLGKGEIENGQQIYVLENVTVPETVATSTRPYKIPIVAQNKSGIHAKGFVSLWVSRDTTSSVAPVISEFNITPNTLSPADESHPMLIMAKIKDEDGGDDITTVAVDLSSVQLNTIFLKPLNTGQESSKTRFFENENTLIIPESVADGSYKIKLTAIDAQGEETEQIKTITVSRTNNQGPSMTNDDSYLTPSNHIVKDGKSTFQIHTKVTDPQGADNITNVSVNMSPLGLPPLSLKGGAIEGRSQWYSSEPLILPMGISVGKQELEITATDKEGNQFIQRVRIEIDRSADNGRPPQVLSDKNYITPIEAIADGETKFSAYVFVQDVDDDISHVILKLGNTALFKGSELPKGTSSKDINGQEQCISTRTLLCMTPIMKENKGQWFYISDLIIPKTTKARDEDYTLEILAIDKNKNSANGTLNVPIRTAETILQNGQNEVTVVQAVKETEIQILFEKAIEPSQLKAELFQITDAENKTKKLDIYSVTASPDGKLVTIKTEEQIAEKDYALNIDAQKIGLVYSSFSDRIFNFTGYAKPDKNKQKILKLINISTNSPEKVILEFSQPLSAKSILNTDNILIIKAGTKTKLEILDLKLKDKKSLEIITKPQQAGSTYNLYYKNISSIYDQKIEKKRKTQFDAFSAPLGENLGNLYGTADFNNDKKVDFADFTLFAAVYGKTYKEVDSGDFDGDGKVDFKDFTLFSAQYGEVLSDLDSGNNSENADNNHNSANPNNYTGTDSTDNSNSGVSGTNQNTQNNNTIEYSATPTPTFSSTPAPLATPTQTPSVTTPTPTPNTHSAAGSSTPIPTYTPRITPTPFPTSHIETRTPQPSPSTTNSPTPTSSASATPTNTSSSSPSPTPSPSLNAGASDVDPLAALLGG